MATNLSFRGSGGEGSARWRLARRYAALTRCRPPVPARGPRCLPPGTADPVRALVGRTWRSECRPPKLRAAPAGPRGRSASPGLSAPALMLDKGAIVGASDPSLRFAR